MFGSLRRWAKPWILSAATGMVVFGLAHQFLVASTLAVFIGLPVAVVLSVPIVAAYAALSRGADSPTGSGFGLMIFAGFVPHYALMTVAMWDRTFDDGPRGVWELLAIGSAPIVSGALCWFRHQSGRGTALVLVGSLVLAFSISGFQASEPDWRNVGAVVSMLPACVAAGWILARTAPGRHPQGIAGAR